MKNLTGIKCSFKSKRDKKIVVSADYKLTGQDIEQDNIIFYSIRADNLFILEKIKQEQKVVYLKDDKLIIFDSKDKLPIIKLTTKSNRLVVNLILFITAFFYAKQIRFLTIRRFLKNIMK